MVKGKITSCRIQENAYVDLSSAAFQQCGNIEVEVVDPVDAYASLMEELFDFLAIREMFDGGFGFRFDAMHAVTRPYAREIFVRLDIERC